LALEQLSGHGGPAAVNASVNTDANGRVHVGDSVNANAGENLHVNAAANTTTGSSTGTGTGGNTGADSGTNARSRVFPLDGLASGAVCPDETEARRRYRDFVAAGIGLDSPWPQLQSQLFLGEETFIDTLKEAIPEKTTVREIPKPQRYATRPPLTEIFSTRNSKKKRDEAIVTGYLTYGYEQKEIADFLGLHYSTVSRVISSARSHVLTP